MTLQPLTFIYCDESCHIENDHQPNMVLGAMACDKNRVAVVVEQIKKIKAYHGFINPGYQPDGREEHNKYQYREVKFNKVSPAKLALYQDLITFFFDCPDLRFRGLISKKDGLNHQGYNQTHDDWYYKMYYFLIDYFINNQGQFHIFLDIKDACGSQKREKLKRVLKNSHHDFDDRLIRDIQAVHSHEVELVQLTDILIGTIMAANRSMPISTAKQQLIQLVRDKCRYSLLRSTPRGERKFNLFHWHPQTERDS